MNESPFRQGRHIAIYFVIALPVHFLFLGRPGIAPTEGIIALGARNMLEGGSWLVVRLYGEIYAYKPPLVYWLSALSQWLFGGHSEWILRLPAATAGLLLGCCILLTLSRWVSPRCGLFSALAYSTSGLILEQARLLGTDVFLTFGFGIAFLAACRNLTAAEARLPVWLVAYAGLLFGLMSKGIPAVAVFFPGLLAAAFLIGRRRRVFETRHLLAAGLFGLSVMAYVGLAWAVDGPAVWQHPLSEMRDAGMRWDLDELFRTLLKPAVILVAFLPWTLALWPPGPRFRALKAWPEAFVFARVAAVFLVAGTVVFMMASVHSTRYYTLLAAPAAVLTGLVVAAWTRETESPDGVVSGEFNDGRRFVLPMLLTILGVAAWLFHVTRIEPVRSQQRSLDRVAAVFAPHLGGESDLRIDAWDGNAALFILLERSALIWRLDDPPPSSPLTVIAVDSQLDELWARRDLELNLLETAVSPQGMRFALVKVSPESHDRR